VQDIRIVRDKETGRSKGFGFVTFENDEEAQNAIAGLNEQDLDGRKVFVNVAKDSPKPNFQNRSTTNRFGGGSDSGYGSDNKY